MSNTKRALAALAMVSVLVVSAGGALAAAPSVDTSGSDATSSTSELQDGSTIDFDANSSDEHIVQIIGDNSTDYGVEFALNDSDHLADGTVFATNESLTNVSTGSEGTHYNATVSEDELADVPMEVGANITMDVTAYQVENASNSTTFQVHLNNTADRTVVYVGDSAADDSDLVDVSEDEGTDIPLTDSSVNIPLLDGADKSTITAEDAKVNGSSTDVVVVLGNDTVADDYDESVGSLDDSAWNPDAGVSFVEDQGVRMFNSELPDDLDLDTTTMTYEEDVGGQAALVYDLGDDAEDESSVDVTAHSSAGLRTQAEAYGWTTAVFGPSVAGFSLGALILFGYRRRQQRDATTTDEAEV